MTIETQTTQDARIISLRAVPRLLAKTASTIEWIRSYGSSRARRRRPANTWVSELDGRRAACGTSGKQHAGGDRLERNSAAGIGQMPRAEDRRRMWIGAELARRARRAVARRFQLAEEIVMLEGRRHQKDGVDNHPGVGQRPPAALSQSAWHSS